MQLPSIVNQVLAFLAGKKTYLLGIAAVAHGLAVGDFNEVWAGLTAMTVRAGIAKA